MNIFYGSTNARLFVKDGSSQGAGLPARSYTYLARAGICSPNRCHRADTSLRRGTTFWCGEAVPNASRNYNRALILYGHPAKGRVHRVLERARKSFGDSSALPLLHHNPYRKGDGATSAAAAATARIEEDERRMSNRSVARAIAIASARAI